MKEGIYKTEVDKELAELFGSDYKPTHWVFAKCGRDKTIRFTHVEESERSKITILYNIVKPESYNVYNTPLGDFNLSKLKISEGFNMAWIAGLESLTRSSSEKLKETVEIELNE